MTALFCLELFAIKALSLDADYGLFFAHMKEGSKIYERASPIRDTCLILIAAVAITTALAYTKPVLVPLTFALFIFGISVPVISWFRERLKLSHTVAVAVVGGLFLLISSVLLLFIINSIGGFLAGASQYKEKIVLFVNNSLQILSQYGIEASIGNYRQAIQELPLFSYATNVTGSLLGIVGQSALVIIFVLFMIFGKKGGDPSPRLVQEIFSSVSRYLSTKLLTSLTTGILVWVVLAIMKVELAFMFGVLTVLLNFIPSLGSIIATFLPAPILLLQYGFGWQTIVVLSVVGGVQFTIGNIIEPKLMGEKLDLHPVAILVFLIFWGIVWGVPGMFLAVPITSVVKIVLYRIPETRNASELLSGRFNF